ncbi:Uncharacterised protein [Mycobacterium tuberculosis]|nr:Uncharacterised protein [Mycobacterium tuberculosis]
MPNSPFGCSTAAYASPSGTWKPSVKSLKWWISSSMFAFIDSRAGAATLWLSVMTGPGLARSQAEHCWMIRLAWRISSTRTR